MNGEASLIVVRCSHENAQALEKAFGDVETSVRTRYRRTFCRRLSELAVPLRVAAVEAAGLFTFCGRTLRAEGGPEVVRDVNEAMDLEEAARLFGLPSLLFTYHLELFRLAELSGIEVVEELPPTGAVPTAAAAGKLDGMRELPGEPGQCVDDGDASRYGDPNGGDEVADVPAEPNEVELVPVEVLALEACDPVPASASGYYIKATVERWVGGYGDQPTLNDRTVWIAQTRRAHVAQRLLRIMKMTHPPTVDTDLPQFDLIPGDSLTEDERFVISEEREADTPSGDVSTLISVAEARLAKLEQQAVAAEQEHAARQAEHEARDRPAVSARWARRINRPVLNRPIEARPTVEEQAAASVAARLARIDAASDALAKLREVWCAFAQDEASFRGVIALHQAFSDEAAHVMDAHGGQGYLEPSADPLRNVRDVAGAGGVQSDCGARNEAIEGAFGELADLRRDVILQSRRTAAEEARPLLPGVDLRPLEHREKPAVTAAQAENPACANQAVTPPQPTLTVKPHEYRAYQQYRTAASYLARLIDDSAAPVRGEPRDPEAWAVAACGSWVIVLDNVSRITAWFSDALCKCVTGDGMIRRKLYTDSAVAVLSFRRVAMLTSIDPGALRGDLAERLLMIDLEAIDDTKRRGETEMEAAFIAARPRVLASLLAMLSGVLRELPAVKLGTMPRMADFARVLAALDFAAPEVTGGRALSSYLAQSGRVASDVIDNDAFACAIVRLADRDAGGWSGTASELLVTLGAPMPLPAGWPRGASTVSGLLKRLTPALARVGVIVRFLPRTAHGRTVTIARRDARPSPAVGCDRQ